MCRRAHDPGVLPDGKSAALAESPCDVCGALRADDDDGGLCEECRQEAAEELAALLWEEWD